MLSKNALDLQQKRRSGGNLGDMVAFILRVFVEIVLQAIFEGIFYGLKWLWLSITGQDGKKRYSKEAHELVKNERRKTLEEIRQKRAVEIRRNREMKKNKQ